MLILQRKIIPMPLDHVMDIPAAKLFDLSFMFLFLPGVSFMRVRMLQLQAFCAAALLGLSPSESHMALLGSFWHVGLPKARVGSCETSLPPLAATPEREYPGTVVCRATSCLKRP